MSGIVIPIPTSLQWPIFQFPAQTSEETTEALFDSELINFITDLGEEGYVLLQPILIEIRISDEGDSYIASFSAADIYSSGDTQQEARDNLKSLILDFFDSLEMNESTLGNSPQNELRILRKYISKHDL